MDIFLYTFEYDPDMTEFQGSASRDSHFRKNENQGRELKYHDQEKFCVCTMSICFDRCSNYDWVGEINK